MFEKRQIRTQNNWSDTDGCKIYTVSVSNKPVAQKAYKNQLIEIKKSRKRDWTNTPSFAIFHDGLIHQYLVFVWWGNDNEMFVSVSVKQDSVWLEDRNLYSFCLWDLEIMWAERNFFIETMYSGFPDINAYKRIRWRQSY